MFLPKLVSCPVLQVFAPTNDAFSALDESLVDFLTSEEGEATLIATLTYHVIPSVVPSTAIADGTSMVASLQGTELSIVKSETGIRINDAANVVVESADVLAINGIVHVIDTVLLVPETKSPTLSPMEGSTVSPTASPTMESGARGGAALTFGTAAVLATMAAVL